LRIGDHFHICAAGAAKAYNMKLLSTLALLLFAQFGLVHAKAEPNIVESTPFTGRPDGLYYFEDSETILTIDSDTQTLYNSRNGGNDWNKVDDVTPGRALRIYLHPRDNQVAVVISDNLEHWITEDQAKSWREFRTDIPADWGDAISFHYSDTKKIMFHSPHYLFATVGKVCQYVYDEDNACLQCFRLFTQLMASRQQRSSTTKEGTAYGRSQQTFSKAAM
jgi:glucose/arabinose dehydrogenase